MSASGSSAREGINCQSLRIEVFFIGELTDDMVQLRRRRQSLNRQKASAIDERGWSEEGPTSQLLCPQHFLKGPTSRENLVQLVVGGRARAKRRPRKFHELFSISLI